MYEKGVKKNECASSCFLLLYTVRSHFYRVSHFFQESCAKNIEENEKKMKNKHRRCGSIMDARVLIYIYREGASPSSGSGHCECGPRGTLPNFAEYIVQMYY